MVRKMDLAEFDVAKVRLGFLVWIICACETRIGEMRLKNVPGENPYERLGMA